MRVVHKVCTHLKRHDAAGHLPSRTLPVCDQCPAWETDKHFGTVKRGCRLRAEEFVNIVETGNPWRKQRCVWPSKAKP